MRKGKSTGRSDVSGNGWKSRLAADQGSQTEAVKAEVGKVSWEQIFGVP